MTKPKSAPEENKPQAPILYDSRISQVVPFILTRGGKDYPITHTVKPLEDPRYFEFQNQIETMAEKVKKVTTALYTPKHGLWHDLVESQTGYEERPNWKEKTHQSDAVAVINAILHAQVMDESEMDEADGAGELFDVDGLTPITFRALQSGKLLTLTHHFRPETQAETDQFLAIETNEPIPNVLASAQKLSKAEKLYNLGKPMIQDREGYAEGSDIPAWHVATTTESFFLRQLARMGKSLAA